MKSYTIISDPGIDDLVALVLLYKLMPRSKNTLISTFGNATEEITSVNAKEFIGFVAEKWNFIHGSKMPLNGRVERPWPDYFHGSDGVWGVHPNVDTMNVFQEKENFASDNIISLATLTEVLQMLRKKNVSEITLMGGAFTIGGNETEFAETNIAFDPDAAKYFFEEIHSIEVKIVPLDVTRKVCWSKEQVYSIPENNDVNIWLKELLVTWFYKYNHEREKDFNLHDPLTIYLEFFPRKAKWIRNGVQVITVGKKRGQTIFSDKNPNCKIAMDLDNSNNIADEIYSIIFG